MADKFLVALNREMHLQQELFIKRPAGTVYIGGGTPSILSPVQLEQLLSSSAAHLSITPDAEWTLEANPGSLSPSHLALAKKWGVNRISLGIQSLSDELLTFLGRPHLGHDALHAVQMVRKAGFSNISIDLIYGIPGQTDKQWTETLFGAINMGAQHISAYSLSIDNGSLFAAKAGNSAFSLPEDELVADQYESARIELKKAGYEQYEISNFSLPGFNCRHNLNYWQRGEYVGFGPGACSFLGNRRYSSVPDVQGFCSRLERGESTIEQQELLTLEQAANETMMLGLRTVRGVDLHTYEKQFGAEAAGRMEKNVERFRTAGLLELYGSRFRFTAKGFLLSNEVMQGLFL